MSNIQMNVLKISKLLKYYQYAGGSFGITATIYNDYNLMIM